MTIIPLAKVTILGLPQDKNTVLEGLQRLGCMHLISLQERRTVVNSLPPCRPKMHAVPCATSWMCANGATSSRSIPPSPSMRWCPRPWPTNNGGVRPRIAFSPCGNGCEEIEPWGQFTLPDLADLDGYRLWLYQVPAAKTKAFLAGLEHSFHSLAVAA